MSSKSSKRHLNKKGFEISVTFIVVIIISLLIFIAGTKLLWDIYGGAESIKKGLDDNTKEEILRLLQQENSIIATPFNLQKGTVGNPVSFGLGIRNTDTVENLFTVVLSFEKGYDSQGRELVEGNMDLMDDSEGNTVLQEINKKWLGNFQTYPVKIKARDFSVIPLNLYVNNILAGTAATKKGAYYVFDVCVYKGVPPGGPASFPEKFFKTCSVNWNAELNNLYTKKIYQVTINVV